MIGKGPAHSISGRTSTTLESSAPGPGAYSPENRPSTSGFSMAGRTVPKLESFSPGMFSNRIAVLS